MYNTQSINFKNNDGYVFNFIKNMTISRRLNLKTNLHITN